MNPLLENRLTGRGGDFPSDDGATAKTIVAGVLKMRDRGQAVTDAQVIEKYPHLADELQRELELASLIRNAMLSARPGNVNPPLPIESGSFTVDPGTRLEHQQDEAARLPHISGFLISRQIDRGGQATVYDAIQESTKRRVAIKVMTGGAFATSRNRTRFEREARILAELDHPNIVSIIERGRTSDGSFFVVLQFIDGKELDTHWDQIERDVLGLRSIVRMFARIAEAIETAHCKGIVHRDLKPSNIVVDSRGEPHILDFGLARPTDDIVDLADRSITVSGQILGSLHWASPEQASGHSSELTAVSDVYSLGVMLYQAIADCFPYSITGSIETTLQRIRNDKPIPPSQNPKCRPGIDRGLDAIVLKALAKLPQNRYESAKALGEDLQAWLDGTKLQAKPRSRFKCRSSYILCGLLAVLASALGGWGYLTRPPHPTVFQLPNAQNSIGMKLVRIPAGKFQMGSEFDESNRNRNELRRLQIIDHPFYLGATAVTQAQYLQIMHDNPSDPRWRNPDMPVQNVTWLQATEFCHRLSTLEHLHYRLPTEAEWEYACRANSLAPYPPQAEPGYFIFSIENSGGMIHPVAQKFPNIWGLFDMQGNVQQWCSDLYTPDGHPEDVRADQLRTRVVRGGSALKPISKCRAASRDFADALFHAEYLGFRVARDP